MNYSEFLDKYVDTEKLLGYMVTLRGGEDLNKLNLFVVKLTDNMFRDLKSIRDFLTDNVVLDNLNNDKLHGMIASINSYNCHSVKDRDLCISVYLYMTISQLNKLVAITGETDNKPTIH